MHLTKNTCLTDCHNFRLNENSLTFLIVKSFVLYGNERRIKKKSNYFSRDFLCFNYFPTTLHIQVHIFTAHRQII